MRGISWLAENRLASQEGLCSTEWVSDNLRFLTHSRFIESGAWITLWTLASFNRRIINYFRYGTIGVSPPFVPLHLCDKFLLSLFVTKYLTYVHTLLHPQLRQLVRNLTYKLAPRKRDYEDQGFKVLSFPQTLNPGLQDFNTRNRFMTFHILSYFRCLFKQIN